MIIKSSESSIEINCLAPREAMGMGTGYLTRRIDNPEIKKAFSKLCGIATSELLSIIEDINTIFLHRYAASQILALRGDPRVDNDNLQMITVPGANVSIGLNYDEAEDIYNKYSYLNIKKAWILKECPKFRCQIKAFKLMKYLVSNSQYREFLRETHHKALPTSWKFGFNAPYYDNHPVYGITDCDAEQYAKWLSEKLDRRFRLPREVEWEYAAGGIEAYEFPWGDEYRIDCANTLEMEIYDTTAVGLFPRGNSPFGISDMAGNVEEYVSDTYQPYQKGEIINDDVFHVSPTYRILRGGAFTRYCDLSRCKRRHGPYPSELYAIGFRLAEDIFS